MKQLAHAFDWLLASADSAFLKASICEDFLQPLWTLC